MTYSHTIRLNLGVVVVVIVEHVESKAFRWLGVQAIRDHCGDFPALYLQYDNTSSGQLGKFVSFRLSTTRTKSVLNRFYTDAFVPNGCLVSQHNKKNLLAQDYVKEYKYPWTRKTPGCLEWDHRKSLIVDKLLDKKAQMDIVCLQEAQMDSFSDLLKDVSPVFDGVIQNVTRGHNVGECSLA